MFLTELCYIRRDEYKVEELVGGTRGKFSIGGRVYVRQDLSLVGFSDQSGQIWNVKPHNE